MLTSEFLANHKLSHTVDENSPELRFLRHICSGGTDIDEYFAPKTACGRDVELAAPDGRFCGINEIREFAANWLKRAKAKSARVEPVIQTIAGGRAVSEFVVLFDQGNAAPLEVPMAIFGDLAPGGRLEGVRLYYFFQWIPGTPAYRRPYFRPSAMKWCDPRLMTGVVRHYYEQLHNGYTDEALEKILEMTSTHVRYGGYRPKEVEPMPTDMAGFRKHYVGITNGIPRDQYIRFETFTDDGLNCLVEWTSIIRMSGLRAGIVSQAGMAAYERDTDGKLLSVRICDNLGFEHEIDRAGISPDDMFCDL